MCTGHLEDMSAVVSSSRLGATPRVAASRTLVNHRLVGWSEANDAKAKCRRLARNANHRCAERLSSSRAVELGITEREDSPIGSNQAISGTVRR